MIMKKGHPCTAKGTKAEEGRRGRMMIMMMKEEREERGGKIEEGDVYVGA